MTPKERVAATILRKVFNREALMPPAVWAKAPGYAEGGITAEWIQAEIDAAKQALTEMEANAAVELEQLRNREEAGDVE